MTMDSNRLMVISSDGHAGARMAEYRSYLDQEYRDEFDDFVNDWNDHGSRNFDPLALRSRLDPEYVDEWTEKMIDTGRIDGYAYADRRLGELEAEGVVAEVIFPDFGMPFELYSPALAASLGHPALDEEHRRAGMRAFNRWLVDFMSTAPERFAGMAAISWQYTVEDAVSEIRWARDSGFKGIVLPQFEGTEPLYHPKFDPIWHTL